MIFKRIMEKLNKLTIGEKVQLMIAIILTLAFVVSVPVLAWFSNQRRIATMARINSPAKLSIRSGYSEEIINFKMSGIDVGEGSVSGHKDFVFCVEGEDVTAYNIQIARTTNINFTYTLYKAHSVDVSKKQDTDVEYTDENDVVRYYRIAEQFQDIEGSPAYGGYINSNNAVRIIGTTNYTEKSYEASDHRQIYAEPLYWQTKSPILAKGKDSDNVSYDEYNAFYDKSVDNKFLNFYILRVSWGAGDVSNDKETDLIYITAQVY